MGAFREIGDLFGDADTVRTAHLLLHRVNPTLRLTWRFTDSPFGRMLLGQTSEGLCWSAFIDDEKKALEEFTGAFPGMTAAQGTGIWLRKAERIIADPLHARDSLCLQVNGSQFRLCVWRELLNTSFGSVTTYGRIAGRLGDPKAARAVGAAVGANPIAFFIPCHRVVNADGSSGQFRWGEQRKTTLIAWEAEMSASGRLGLK